MNMLVLMLLCLELKLASFPPPPSSYAAAASAGVSSVSGSFGPKVTKLASAITRADNLIIFGLPEVESLPALNNSLDELLTLLVGKSVPLRDLFRLGHRRKISDSGPPGRPWPVLLKFMSTWDRRLLLSAVSKLKEFKMLRLYIREDLSPEECKKRRDHYGSRKAMGAGSSSADSHSTLRSQPLTTQSQSLSPCNFPSSANVSGSSGSPTLDAQ